jgi:hypothetical protein
MKKTIAILILTVTSLTAQAKGGAHPVIPQNGQYVHVNSYTRADGTVVQGYYRSCPQCTPTAYGDGSRPLEEEDAKGYEQCLVSQGSMFAWMREGYCKKLHRMVDSK